MQRRQFLTAISRLVVMGAASTKVWAGAMSMGETAAPASLLPVDALPRGLPLRELGKLTNESKTLGLFRATLTAAPLRAELVAGHATEFWTYNGSLPGPLIEVFEGDTIEITFVNRLKQPSSIHWHGLPVPPEQDGNPQNPVPPGGKRVYRFTLPDGCAGTYWYHPHPHTYTAEQAFRGLAGLFIVRARQDPLNGIPERLLVTSDLKLDQQGKIPADDADDWMNGREGQFVLVNAQHMPVVRFDTGGRERWRIWNACSARYLRLTLPGIGFALVGTDGGLIEHPIAGLQEFLVVPAQRAELIVDAGTHRDRVDLTAAVYPRGKMGEVAPDKALSLLTVDFSPVRSTIQPPLPLQLCSIADLGPVKAHKRVVFTEQMSMKDGRHQMSFLVNGKTYDMKRVDLTSRRNEVELWEIVNQADMDHPFHLHGTQFQVVEREIHGVVTPEPFRAWHDTVNLKSGETVRIKAVQRWRGLRMFHCHILEHEGLGMMGQLKVV
ncbi:multicopper oxidase family protein [Pseudogulbenkiania subflava]|uniref:Bilirubin oxidase n=1 Tax=Pseudogulbenkiania subflava DSM 22618 TaxID=1123014 RepID=A0A1Y6BC28_9NEIS|nr:multicopper oxidase family protein [Pseudogulbenkiania subflava]SMF03461.1 bilirubin oxidase [Pseudogulbenkiania subflava DSM 22618]